MNNKKVKQFREDPWENILEPNYPNGQRLYEADRRFWVAINDKQQPIFFIIEEGNYELEKLPNLSGVEIRIEPEANGSTRLICTLLDIELRHQFAYVAKDVALYCEPFKGQQLIRTFNERMISWAHFLKPSRSGLTYQEFIGFWGEMYFLTKEFTKIFRIDESIQFWIGILGKKQDFTINNIAIEVKTTKSGDANLIKISSIEQLEQITPKLYLAHLHINDTTDPSGLSLEDMHEGCKNALSNNTKLQTEFINKASKLYSKANEEQLQKKMCLLQYDIYEVKDGFPKITPSDHNGISSAKYSINPSYINDYFISNNLEELFKNRRK